jgi:hypothetical protein
MEIWEAKEDPPEWWAEPPDRRWTWVRLRTSRRFSRVRDWWLESNGIYRTSDAVALIPRGSPWSMAYLLSDVGQAERVGYRPGEEIVDERLARAGVTRADLPDLLVEAQTLSVLANRAHTACERRFREDS